MVFFEDHRRNMHDAMDKDLKKFIGHHDIKSFADFVSTKDDEVAIVVACYFGVFEGVDMWFSGDNVGEIPRFRLQIKAGELRNEVTFALFDDIVNKLAPETCSLLASMCEAASIYPDEMEELFGDHLIFKVSKESSNSDDESVAYRVLDVCADPFLVSYFRHDYVRDWIYHESLDDVAEIDHEDGGRSDNVVDGKDGLVEVEFAVKWGRIASGGGREVGTKRKFGESYDEVVFGPCQRPLKMSKVIID